jgi:hypothetical protein
MRFRSRHVHETLKQYVTDTLTSQGWVSAPVNFGTTPVTVLGHMPLEAGETPAPNTVAVSLGDESKQEDEELGAGLQSVRYVFFVDVWGATEGVGESIAQDVKDAFVNKVLTLRDFTSDADGTATTDQLEFEMVVVEKIASATTTVDKRTWRSVKGTAVCYFQD